jgi:hypothetical protein
MKKRQFYCNDSRAIPDVKKARAEFEMAQEVEERFLHDFDGVDFTVRYGRTLGASRADIGSVATTGNLRFISGESGDRAQYH